MSKEETIEHIARVGELLGKIIVNLEERIRVHDRSKLKEPEASLFDEVTGTLRGLTYGSDEYREQLKRLAPALVHHYENNSHHPEYYENGIAGMSLLDIVEMFADWKAATERHADGSLEKSIQINKPRFGYPDILEAIFENTRKELGW